MHDWIAVTGLRAVRPGASTTDVPTRILESADLSLEARGLYGLVLSYQGQPIDPYVHSVDDDVTTGLAIEELIAADLVRRIPR